MAEFFDVEGIPVSLGASTAGLYSAAWDVIPPRLFDPESARRNGAPVSETEFIQLLSRAALIWIVSKTGLSKTGELAQTLSWQDQVTQNLQAAVERFKTDNQGKTWEDLAKEHEARINELATRPLENTGEKNRDSLMELGRS